MTLSAEAEEWVERTAGEMGLRKAEVVRDCVEMVMLLGGPKIKKDLGTIAQGLDANANHNAAVSKLIAQLIDRLPVLVTLVALLFPVGANGVNALAGGCHCLTAREGRRDRTQPALARRKNRTHRRRR